MPAKYVSVVTSRDSNQQKTDLMQFTQSLCSRPTVLGITFGPIAIHSELRSYAHQRMNDNKLPTGHEQRITHETRFQNAPSQQHAQTYTMLIEPMSGSSNQNYENRRIARGKRNSEANNRENSEQNWGISCCSNSDRFPDNLYHCSSKQQSTRNQRRRGA